MKNPNSNFFSQIQNSENSSSRWWHFNYLALLQQNKDKTLPVRMSV